MNSPNKGRTNPPLATSWRLGYNQLNCWSKMLQENAQITCTIHKKTDCSPETHIKTPLLKTAPIQLIEFKK